VESPYEVKDYVRQYLGESGSANDFGRQFLERRSAWLNQRRSRPAADDMCSPAPAITPAPPVSHEFTEVKVKYQTEPGAFTPPLHVSAYPYTKVSGIRLGDSRAEGAARLLPAPRFT